MLHKATATSLGTQALILRIDLCSLTPYVQLHLVKQESHRYQYENGKVDVQAVYQRTTHLPALWMQDLDRKPYTPRAPTPRPRTPSDPDWVPDNASYTSHDRAYHYPDPVQHLAPVLRDAVSRAHIEELQETPKVPLYHSALRPACVPAHLQKRRTKILQEQLPPLSRVAW